MINCTLLCLIYGLIVRSGNDAAYAIANHVGGNQEDFVHMMNEKAKEIGSDYIVVGRPITQAEDPVAAYRRCVAEFVG